MTLPIGVLESSRVSGGGGPPPVDLPSAPAAQWSQAFGAINVAQLIIPIGVAVDAGQLLVLDIQVGGSVSLAYTATDSEGNVYDLTYGQQAATTTHGIIAYCQVANALTTSDTLTLDITGAGSITRATVWGSVWDWEFGSVVIGAWKSEDSTTAFESQNADIPDDAVLIGNHSMINSGRTSSVGSPWTGVTKIVTTAGSGERALQPGWRVIEGAAANVNYPVSYTSSGSGVTGFVAFVR